MTRSTLSLTKHHGLGNDFLVLLAEAVPADHADLAQRLCDRRHGIGADGLIVAVETGNEVSGADAVVEFHLANRDGSIAEVSGNGLRCLAQAWAMAHTVDRCVLSVPTLAGTRRVELLGPSALPHTVEASVEMGVPGPGAAAPADLVADVLTRVGDLASGLDTGARWATVDMGNPHVVFEVADPSIVDLERLGPAVEAVLGPINAHFVRRAPGQPHRVDLAVWERGAGATAACGSGACAAAAVAHDWGWTGPTVEVAMLGGRAVVELVDGAAVLTGPSTHVAWIEVPRD